MLRNDNQILSRRHQVKIIVFLLFSSVLLSQEAIIIDHNSTDITKIPERAILVAKEKLHIAYNHTSHGSQIVTGMAELIDFANKGGKGLGLATDIFAYNNGGSNNSLDLHDQFAGWLDCGTYPEWVQATRNYLNEPGNSDVNVIMWSWCGQVDSKYADGRLWSEYLEPMNQLEQDFPDVIFVYMTGHVDINDDLNNKAANDSIRSYCKNNNKVLYDFADIERYDPDGNYFEYVHDNCDYYNSDGKLLGNWAIEWQNSHIEGQDWYNCTSAHSQPLNANQKAYAAWWLFSRLGGWNNLDTIKVSIDSTTGYLDDTISVPIRVSFPADFKCQSIDIDIVEKSDGLQFIGEDTSNGLLSKNDWIYFINTNDSSVKVAGTGLNYITGNDTLIQFRYKLVRNLCNFEPLVIESAYFNDGLEAMDIDNGGVYIWPQPYFGDVNRDEIIDQSDAEMILEYLTGSDSLLCQNMSNANVDLDNIITSLDASIILQYENHDITSLPYYDSDFFLASGNLNIKTQEYMPGQKVYIPLNISNWENIYGFQGQIIFNPNHLIYDTIKWTNNFDDLSQSVRVSNDSIIFAGASSNYYMGDSNFATLEFTAVQNPEVDTTLICLEKFRWNNSPDFDQPICVNLINKTKIEGQLNIPKTYTLNQNYPNPFNNSTKIEYFIPTESIVILSIYNLHGEIVKVLIKKKQRKGAHSINWHAGNISSGVYFCRLNAGGLAETRKMLLLK